MRTHQMDNPTAGDPDGIVESAAVFRWDLFGQSLLTAGVGALLIYSGFRVGGAAAAPWLLLSGALGVALALLAGFASAGWQKFERLPLTRKAPVAVTMAVWFLASVLVVGIVAGAVKFVAVLFETLLGDLGG
jgi:hypothetical protein